MDDREQERPPLAPGGAAWHSLGAARERVAFFVQQRVLWPVEDRTAALGARGRIGVLGGGALAAGAVVAALLSGGPGGSDSGDAAAAVAVVPSTSVAPKATPAPAPKTKKKAAKPAGSILHGAPPDFSPAQDVKAGVGDGKAVERSPKTSPSADTPAERGAASGAGDTPAATAKIGASPAASAAAEAQASSLATSGGAGTGVAESSDSTGTVGSGTGETGSELAGPPAPRAAKQTARRFAEAFVVYEVGGVDGQVRSEFRHTTTKQLSRSLLQRPPRQPAAVKVPQAKVVNVVAGPSRGTVYTVSVSLLRVGVTSELRLELEQGPGKKWQVTNVLG
jgi:hypothetical protein